MGSSAKGVWKLRVYRVNPHDSWTFGMDYQGLIFGGGGVGIGRVGPLDLHETT